MSGILRCNGLANGFKAIDNLYTDVAAYQFRLKIGICCLISVEIAIGCGSHDHVVSHLCCHDARLYPAPRHHCGRRVDAALCYLIPSYQFTAVLHQISIDAPCEIALQQVLCRLFISGFDTLLADALLTAFTLLPLALRGLVASDMDIL